MKLIIKCADQQEYDFVQLALSDPDELGSGATLSDGHGTSYLIPPEDIIVEMEP